MVNHDSWQEVDYGASLLRQIDVDSVITPEPTAPTESQNSKLSPVPVGTKTTKANLASTSPAKPPVRKMIDSVIKKCGGYNDFKKNFVTESYSLYLRDIGCQVEFHELLPLLSFGPSIIFFVFRADLDFGGIFEVDYRKGTSEPYSSSTIIEESLLQCLASLYTLDSSNTGIKTHKPLVFIIGTHKDKLGASADSVIAEVNQRLHSVIVDGGFQSLVEYADHDEDHVMFTVDNTSEDDADFKAIRSRVHSLISYRSEFTIKYPISYLFFCLELQHEKRDILTLDQCRVIAAKYGIVDDQVFHLLHFLRFRIGVIQYFDIKGLRHVVFNKPQILFKKVSDFIVTSFSREALVAREVNNFITFGTMTASFFENCFGSWKMSSEEFLHLLVHLRFITPVPTSRNQEKSYFVPCVLNHNSEQGEEASEEEPDVLPLSILFKCKHCPKGLFGVLITHLLNLESDTEAGSDITFTLVEEKTTDKDEIFFKVHSLGVEDEVSLKLFSTRFEIKVFPDMRRRNDSSISDVCSNIRKVIYIYILKSMEAFRYNEHIVEPMMCLKCNDCSELHQVKKGEKECKMYCGKTGKQNPVPLQGKCWFSKGKCYNNKKNYACILKVTG